MTNDEMEMQRKCCELSIFKSSRYIPHLIPLNNIHIYKAHHLLPFFTLRLLRESSEVAGKLFNSESAVAQRLSFGT